MSTARKILSNTLWQVIGKIIWSLLGVVSIKLITNYLDRSTYGEYTTIYDFTALFAIVADLGLFTIAVREMAKENNKGNIEKIIGNVMTVRGLTALASLAVGTVVAYTIPAYNGTHIPLGILAISAATVMALLAGTMSAVLQFYLKMAWSSFALIIGKIITVGYIAATVFWWFPHDPTHGFIHLLIAWIFGGLFTMGVTYWAAHKHISIRFRFDPVFIKHLVVKALPYGLALMLGTIYFRTGTIIMSLYGMKEQVAYFGVPMRVVEILQIVPHYFMNSVLPVLTVALMHNRVRAGVIGSYALRFMMMLALPTLVGGFFIAWPLTALVSSPQFLSQHLADGTLLLGSDVGLQILLGAVVCNYIYAVLSYTFVAMGKQKEVLKANAVGVVVNIILNVLLAPRYGFIGAAISSVATEVCILLILSYKMRAESLHLFDGAFFLKTVLSTVVMGAALFFLEGPLGDALHSKSIALLVPIGALVFASMMFGTKAITKEMLQKFRQQKEVGAETHEPVGL